MKPVIRDLARRIQKARVPNTQMDLLKLYGIFCVVYAHCYAHGLTLWGHGVVSSVYVIQLFIFCSGYFYRTEQDRSGLSFLKKCAKSYLLPYFCWNLLYGLVRALLAAVGLTTFGAPISLYTLLVQPWTNAEQFMLNVPSWFLLSLFLVAMISWLLRRLISALRPMDGKADGALLLELFLIGLFAVWRSGQWNLHLGLDGAVLRPMVLLPYFQLGIVYRKYRGRLPHWSAWALPVVLAALSALLQLGNGSPFQTKMLYCYFEGDPLWLMTAAAACVLLTAEVCALLAPLLERFRVIHYAGKCTMYIMLHHLFLLYAIQLLWRILNRFRPLPGYDAAAFRDGIWYRYCFGRSWLMVVYLALALAIPVALHYVYERFILRLDAQSARPARR